MMKTAISKCKSLPQLMGRIYVLLSFVATIGVLQSCATYDIPRLEVLKVEELSSINASINAIFFFDENIGCAVGDDAFAITTVDGGTTWTRLDVDSIDSDFNSVVIIDPETILISGAKNEIKTTSKELTVRTRNGGDSWDTINSINGELVSESQFANYQVFRSSIIRFEHILDSLPISIPAFSVYQAGQGERIKSVAFTDDGAGAIASSRGIYLLNEQGAVIRFRDGIILDEIAIEEKGKYYGSKGAQFLKEDYYFITNTSYNEDSTIVTIDTFQSMPNAVENQDILDLEAEQVLQMQHIDIELGAALTEQSIALTFDAGLSWTHYRQLNGAPIILDRFQFIDGKVGIAYWYDAPNQATLIYKLTREN